MRLQGVDVIIVPSACAGEASAAAPRGSPLTVRHAESLLEAVNLIGS